MEEHNRRVYEEQGKKVREQESGVSRRGFIKKAGSLTAGAGALALLGGCTSQQRADEDASTVVTSGLVFDTYLDVPLFHNNAAAVTDKWNIKELVEFDRWTRDQCQWDKMLEGYLEDSIVNVSWFNGNGRDFVKQSAGMGKGTPGTSPKHKIFNTQVWLNGDKAIAEVPCMMLSPHGSQYKGMDYTCLNFARLFERVEKVDGVWGIRQFDCIYERGYIVPLAPSADFVIDPAEFEGYRESYRCICWELKMQNGLDTRQDLPGEDDPATLDILYREASAWLSA